MAMLTMSEVNLKDKLVMIREDFNVPMVSGQITSDARIEAALPTIMQALSAGAKVVLLSHLGRPEEGRFSSENSLAPVARRLAQLLGRPVPLLSNWLNGIDIRSGEVALCENVRFNKGEKTNSIELSKKMAALCDVFVMDAFATAHRTEASTYGMAQFAPVACAGPLLVSELEALGRALQNPNHPLLAIVGGAKVSSKLHVLEFLIKHVNVLLLGGGIANTFIAEAGYAVGRSLYEVDLLPEAKRLMALAKQKGVIVPLPLDVVVSENISEAAEATIKSIEQVGPAEKIVDIGPKTIAYYCELISQAKTILWNGPVGVFEMTPFSKGTADIAQAIANSQAFSVAGGGDTIAAIDKFQVADRISYISTGGGAFLEYVEGKTLPAVSMLEQRAGETSHLV
ncbi:MAG: phosphoglycerate kinase [Gammaproteobacteria bacterium]|nr:phosphoglycerate kinase [Gammaproteobacteria bacterium]